MLTGTKEAKQNKALVEKGVVRKSKRKGEMRLRTVLLYLMCSLLCLLGFVIAIMPITQGTCKIITKKDMRFISISDIVGEDMWETPRYLIAGVVKIDLNTGEVEIKEGVTLTEASEQFWRAISEAFGSELTRLKSENEKLRQKIKSLEAVNEKLREKIKKLEEEDNREPVIILK